MIWERQARLDLGPEISALNLRTSGRGQMADTDLSIREPPKASR